MNIKYERIPYVKNFTSFDKKICRALLVVRTGERVPALGSSQYADTETGAASMAGTTDGATVAAEEVPAAWELSIGCWQTNPEGESMHSSEKRQSTVESPHRRNVPSLR